LQRLLYKSEKCVNQLGEGCQTLEENSVYTLAVFKSCKDIL
jgi:hypothetical protein